MAPAFRLARLPENDPALEKLRNDLRMETGIPDELTNKIIKGLAGVDHLGTLLKVDQTIEDALRAYERPVTATAATGDLFTRKFPAAQTVLPIGETRATVLDKLEPFLARHTQENDLGLRLDGEQIAAGVRFIRMVKERSFDLVVANPPYQGTSKMADSKYVAESYPRGKADLYAAFLERGLGLVREGGIAAMVTMRGWMSVGQFAELRQHLLDENSLRALGDVGWGAFQEMTDSPVVLSIFARIVLDASSVAVCPTSPTDRVRTDEHFAKTVAGLWSHVGRHVFDRQHFRVIDGAPVVYWWSPEFLRKYANATLLGVAAPARFGLTTGDNERFVKLWHELQRARVVARRGGEVVDPRSLRVAPWVPFVLGGKGRVWIEPLHDVCRWQANGLEVKEKCVFQYGTVSKQIRNEDFYFCKGVAFSMVGSSFSARAHRFYSVFGNKGSSAFPSDVSLALCLMNSATARFVLESLNPGIGFEVGDVNRLPIFPIESADQIYATIDRAFTEHEAAREASVEFKHPAHSPWIYAQDWAQRCVDRPAGAPLPPFTPVFTQPTPVDFLSFFVGVALGRFDAMGAGLLDKAPPTALPAGILYISPSRRDSLDHPATKLLRSTWAEQSRGDDEALRDWFRKDFFTDHKSRYESRPIVFPLSSAKKSFVALVAIHRFTDATLQTLLADWILPDRRALEGELTDLRAVRVSGSADQKRQAERRFADVQKLLEELDDFLGKLTQCAEKGAPPSDSATKPRAADAPYAMDLDDGVMVNSAALWPLLEPQWKDPKKWWKELCNASGKKDYDWCHLAARYFPARVDAKCQLDPSLGVAHGCFWRYHPAKAYAWELRLKDEIGPDFLIEEADAVECRARFVKDHPDQVRESLTKETARRERKKRKEEGAEQAEMAFEAAEEEDADA